MAAPEDIFETGELADSSPHFTSAVRARQLPADGAPADAAFRLGLDGLISGLDAQRRERLQVELRAIQRRDAKTIVFVTHDVEEAVFLADRVIVFSKRPARVMADIDITERLGAERPLELRDSPEFFQLRNAVLRLLREEAGDEE